MQTECLTVVVSNPRDPEFSKIRDALFNSQAKHNTVERIGEGKWVAHAISRDDEMQRLQLIEEAVSLGEYDLLEGILAHPTIGKYKDLDAYKAEN